MTLYAGSHINNSSKKNAPPPPRDSSLQASGLPTALSWSTADFVDRNPVGYDNRSREESHQNSRQTTMPESSPPRSNASPSAGMRPMLHASDLAGLDPRDVRTHGVQVKQITVVHDSSFVLGIGVRWSTGASSTHGVEAAGDDVKRVVCELEDGERISKIGIKCDNAERNSSVYAITIHTHTGGMRTKWLGGDNGSPQFLSAKDGHSIIGFAGRCSQRVDALGIITASPQGDIERGLVFGGPSGIPFSDVAMRDCSQLSTFVLRSAFRDSGSAYMLESARHLFMKIQELCPSSAHREALIAQASAHFGVSIEETQGDVAVSPLVVRRRSERDFRRQGEGHPLGFNVFTEEFCVTDHNTTASCQVSAGWRTLMSSLPLPKLSGPGVLEMEILMQDDLRLTVVGVASVQDGISEFDRGTYIGCTDASVGYQSTGHVAASGELRRVEGSDYSVGASVTLLVTESHVHFYKNQEFVATADLPAQAEGSHLYLAVSCYMGPNTFSLVGCNLWDKVCCRAGETRVVPPQPSYDPLHSHLPQAADAQFPPQTLL